MNLNGVTGDARKRIEHEAAPTFDRHPECLICGRREAHTHGDLVNVNYLPIVPLD